jgi:superfamily II DNA or RNA helicase
MAPRDPFACLASGVLQSRYHGAPMAERRTRRGKSSDKDGDRAAGRARRGRNAAADAQIAAVSVDDVELHRHGFIVHVPGGAGGAPATAMLLDGEAQAAFCTCEQAGKGRGPCPHVERLHALRRELGQALGASDVNAAFRDSLWYRLLAPLADDHDVPVHTVMVRDEVEDGAPVVRVYEPGGGGVLVTYVAGGRAAERFRSRLVLHDRGGPGPPRALLLQWLMERTATAYEHDMRALGHRTHGQVIEESFWFRLAYHAYREHGREVRFAPAIDRESGAVRVEARARGHGQAPLFRVTIPQRAACAFLRAMRALLPAGESLPVRPGALRPLVRMVARQGGGLRIEPVVRVTGRSGEERILLLEERFRYGDLAYLPALDLLVALDEPGPVAAALHLARPVDVDGARTSNVLGKVAMALGTRGDAAGDDAGGESGRVEGGGEGGGEAGDEILGLRVLTSFDRVAVDSEALGRDWCWLSMRYGAGAASVTLDEVLAARQRGQRFLDTEDGWVDTESPAFAPLAALLAQHQIKDLDTLVDVVSGALSGATGDAPPRLRVSRLALLRLLAAGGAGLAVSCQGPHAEAVERLLAVAPVKPLAPLAGLRSTLRDYQVRGVEWLLYLYDNGFGGLLCDDMGLGKTHQVAAFLVALREQRKVQGRFLVVCPTTVLSHWQRIIDAHVPGLRAAVFHGGGRDLAATVDRADLVLTSYGILRNDIDELARIELAAAVFDEAQLLKNPQTLAYQAATRLSAGMRLGLSGTPIENGIEDLAALLDLTVPGYLGSMEEFRARFVVPIEERGDAEARRDLERLVAPFLLRRTKHAVLDQLPPKIEDVRTCALSEEQIKLYRDAVDTRGRELIAALRNQDRPVPYIHIFALLTLLKQICCHPALVAGDPEHHEDYESAKWELAKELLRESLESGHKVVVYSQFLGMLRIFERHLAALGIGHTKLTGQTRDRGAVIARFQEDPSCRVFLASLTAGGVGIDLVAASVVMHYDRWWNAAREDQATDRVHRIGQTRGVHVLKLITEGTLEEKIAAIIARKRQLMESVVHEDDQGTLEVLDREELAALMSFDLQPAAQRD